MTLNDIPSLGELMKSWTQEPGFPIVTITRNYKRRTISLKQEAKGDDPFKERLWWIPLDYTYADGGAILGKFWMENKSEISLDIALSSARPVLFNINWDGYYVVNYDDKNWDMIADVLIQDHSRMRVQNRAQILYDSFEMQWRGKANHAVVKKIYGYLKKESEYLP